MERVIDVIGNSLHCLQLDRNLWRVYVKDQGSREKLLNVTGRPENPQNTRLSCEETRARIQWISSFNGGDSQTFTVLAFNDEYRTSYSKTIPDMGENVVHSIYIQNLQPSTLYVFFVSAQNSHGNTKSENISCTTQNQDTDSLQVAVIAGGVGGTLTVIVIVLITVLIVHRRYSCICALKKRNKNKTVTMKEDTSYYSTIAEQESRERNVYERPNANCSEKHDIHNSQKKELKTKDPTTQSSKDYTIKPAEVYVNTSFM